MDKLLEALGIRWQLVLTQLVGFLIVFFVLKKLLFERIQAVMAERAAEEERRRHAIARSKKEAEAARARADERHAEIEKQAYEQAQAEVRAGLKRKSDLTSAALDRARAGLVEARGKHAAEHDRSLSKIRSDVVGLALYVGGRAAGRPDLESSPDWRSAGEREVEAVLAAHPEIFPRMSGGGAAA